MTSARLVLLASLVATALPLGPTGPAHAQTVTGATSSVRIVEPNKANQGTWGYDPAGITVPVGTTVTWTNTGGEVHSVTANKASADQYSADLQPGQVFQHTFAQPGTFAYHCREHPWMKGTVTVH